MKSKKITIIGSGKMAEAILQGIIKAKLIDKNHVLMTDINENRLNQLKDSYQINTSMNNASSVDGADIILLAVKPQQIEDVLNEITSILTANQLILSILAGTTLSTLDREQKLKVARLMTNTPALIGEAMTVISCNPRVDDNEKELVKTIFNSIGEVIELPEKLLNSVTAVSGSGPAFVFRIMEGFIEGAMEIGLPYKDAKKLIFQTFKGSAILADTRDIELQELVKQVSSPGGTTVAGRNILENSNYKKVLKETLLAAKTRADELSGDS